MTKEMQKELEKNNCFHTRNPNMKGSIWQIVNTFVPFFLLWYLAYQSLSVSYFLTFGLTVIAAGFLIRIFIIFHDCCHNPFLTTKMQTKWSELFQESSRCFLFINGVIVTMSIMQQAVI